MTDEAKQLSMMSLQRHGVTSGLPLRRTMVAMGILGFVLTMLSVAANGFMVNYELAHYAELASNVAAGHGFVTNIAQPAALALYDAEGLRAPWPVVDRFLGPVLVASFFVSCGLSAPWAVVAVDALAAGVLAATATATAWALSGARGGLIAGALILMNPLVTGMWAAGGLADPPFGAAFGVVLCLVVRAAHAPPTTRDAAALGLGAGCLVLARYNGVLLVPGVVLAWALVRRHERPGPRHFVVVFATAAAVALPPIAWVYATTGALPRYVVGIWALMSDVAVPEPWRAYRVWGLSDAADYPASVWLAKVGRQGLEWLLSAWDMFDAPVMVATAALGYLLPTGRKFAALCLLLVAPHLLMHVTTRTEEFLGSVWRDRYLAPLLVPVAVSAATTLQWFMSRHAAGVFGVTALLITQLLLTPEKLTFRLPMKAETYWARDLVRSQPAGALIMSNAAFSLALHYKRPFVDLPREVSEIEVLQRQARTAAWIFDTDEYLGLIPRAILDELMTMRLARHARNAGLPMCVMNLGLDGRPFGFAFLRELPASPLDGDWRFCPSEAIEAPEPDGAGQGAQTTEQRAHDP